jgi:uncharacterized protein DUF4307
VSAQDTLDERYGVAGPWRRRTLVGACALLVVVFGAWVAWTVYEHATPSVTSQLETFSVDDDHTATAILVVSLDSADVRATCTLRALAEDHSTVGEVTFTPDPAKGQRQVQTIRTDRRATSVTSLGCTAPDQDEPR